MALGIQGVLQGIVQINALAILNGITSSFASSLMGESFLTQINVYRNKAGYIHGCSGNP